MLLLLLLQATAPDIQLGVEVRARSVAIERKGEARLQVRSEPDGGNLVDVDATRADGRRTLRNVRASVRVEGRIGDPTRAGSAPVAAETSAPN